jgi:hypothetical protein
MSRCTIPLAYAHRQLVLPGQPRALRLPFDEGHRVIEDVGRSTGRQQRNDVRMLQRCRQLDFAIETIDADFGGELRRQNFHDNAAAESRFFGEEDAAHSAAAQLPLDAVRRAEGGLQFLRQIRRCHGRLR